MTISSGTLSNPDDDADLAPTTTAVDEDDEDFLMDEDLVNDFRLSGDEGPGERSSADPVDEICDGTLLPLIVADVADVAVVVVDPMISLSVPLLFPLDDPLLHHFQSGCFFKCASLTLNA